MQLEYLYQGETRNSVNNTQTTKCHKITKSANKTQPEVRDLKNKYRAHSLAVYSRFGGIHHRCSHNRLQIGRAPIFLTDLYIVPAKSTTVQYHVLIPAEIGYQQHFHLLNNTWVQNKKPILNNACISELEKRMITKKVENIIFILLQSCLMSEANLISLILC